VHPKVRRDLRHVELHIRHRTAVAAQWGFDRRLSLAEGVTVLFAGPSGTGKTLAAEVLAHELRLELFRVDLSAIVSKYVGETEKQLEQLFDTARDANAIVFFDEADATFGKRSEVGDAHDRYANIEVAYLLQKIEEYTGVVILATNLRRNIDEAFARRLDHTVEFTLPRTAERRRILDLLLGEQASAGGDVDLDLDFVAERFDLTGGNLRNVVVAAAFFAADDGGPITTRHLVHATARELEKIGRLPTRSDFGPYFPLLHETTTSRRSLLGSDENATETNNHHGET
jgi:SpoVK/Ycf46/Vps4 family AAA+-type ATPase